MSRSLLLLALALCLDPAHAHRLRVFAFTDGGELSGSVYFSGGAPAPGARIEIQAPPGRLRVRLVADPDGAFAWTSRSAVDHLVVADTGDGHRAEWRLSAAEFGAATATAPEPVEGQVAASPVRGEAERVDAAAIERMLARQIAPLRRQLLEYEDKVRLHDVLGGLGYIFGLAGLALWWRSRDRRQKP